MWYLSKFFTIFRFPRPDLENRWWHRTFKVLAVASTIVLFLFSIRWANEAFYPYYVYSCQGNFQSYGGKIKNWAELKPSYQDKDDMVFKCEYTRDRNFAVYGISLKVHGKDYVAIADELQKAGVLKDLKVKDIGLNFYGGYYRVAFIILLPILWYLFAIHVIYRTIAYIFVGVIEVKSKLE